MRRVAAALDAEVAPSGSALPQAGRVTVENLRVRRRDGYAPDGVSFTARPGEVVRLDTPSGSGKSSTFAVLLGFVRPDAGRVLVGGVDLADTTRSVAAYGRVGAAAAGIHRRHRGGRAGAGRR